MRPSATNLFNSFKSDMNRSLACYSSLSVSAPLVSISKASLRSAAKNLYTKKSSNLMIHDSIRLSIFISGSTNNALASYQRMYGIILVGCTNLLTLNMVVMGASACIIPLLVHVLYRSIVVSTVDQGLFICRALSERAICSIVIEGM